MSANQLRILVADDEPAVRSMMERIIRGHGHHFDGVENGKACLHKLQQGHYDLLFLDLFMPILDGVHVLKHAREHAPATRVVAISSLDDTIIIGNILKSGACAFLIKPLRDALITEVMNRVAAGTISQDLTPSPGNDSAAAP